MATNEQTPEVVRVLEEYKAAMAAREKAQLKNMARQWFAMEKRLSADIKALADEIADLRKRGIAVPRSKLYTMTRYKDLLAQADQELNQYVNYLDNQTRAERKEFAKIGIQSGTDAIRASMVASGNGQIWGRFDGLDHDRIADMVIYTSQGAPLEKLLQTIKPAAISGMTDALVDAMARGYNPRKTARMMADGAALGLQRAMVIARDQQMRAHRAAVDETYKQSGVVQGKKRLAAKNGRTCMGCIALDGQILPVDEPSYDHVCGRCVFVPILKFDRNLPDWENAKTWFETLDPRAQREMMGTEAWKMWKDGKFTLAQMAKITEHKVWGKGVGVKNLKELRALPPPPAPKPPRKPRTPKPKPPKPEPKPEPETPPAPPEKPKRAPKVAKEKAPKALSAREQQKIWENTWPDNYQPKTRAEAFGIVRQLEEERWNAKFKANTSAERTAVKHMDARIANLKAQAANIPLADGSKVREQLVNLKLTERDRKDKLYREIDKARRSRNYALEADLNRELKSFNSTRQARELIYAEQPLSLTVKQSGKTQLTADHYAGVDEFCKVVGNKALPGEMKVNIKVDPKETRAYYQDTFAQATLGPASSKNTVVHELGHWYEYRNDWAYKHIRDWFDRRTAGEVEEKLSKLTGWKGYSDDEVAKPDRFHSPYVGKLYMVAGKKTPLEIVSMGLERLYADPIEFAKNDPDYFDLIWSLIR